MEQQIWRVIDFAFGIEGTDEEKRQQRDDVVLSAKIVLPAVAALWLFTGGF